MRLCSSRRAARWATGAAVLIRIYAAGTSGSESMRLFVDDQPVATWNQVGGNAQAGQFVEFEASVSGPVSPDGVRVAFLNDNGPRDLRVDRIEIDGLVFETEAPTVWSTGTWTSNGFVPGYWQSEWLHGTGWFQYAEVEPGPIPGRLGAAEFSDQWAVVSDPVAAQQVVAIAGPATLRETDPGAVAIRLVDSYGFDLRLQEWVGEDGPHGAESADWMLLPRGRHVTSDGSVWETGVLSVSGNGQWTARSFGSEFGSVPYLFLTLQTSNGNRPLAVRARNVDEEGFEAALFTAESQLGTAVNTEQVGYLAIEPAAGSGVVTIGDVTVPYRVQRLAVSSALTGNGGGFSLMAQEDRSLDEEANHPAEPADVLQLGSLVFVQDTAFADPDPFVFRVEKLPAGVTLPPGFRIDQVVPGAELDDAVAIDLAADGRIFIAEESGLVWVVVNGVRQAEPWLDLRSEVFRDFADEGALSGFVLDPSFMTNGFVYALYTTGVAPNNTFGRLARFRKSTAAGAGPLNWQRTILIGNSKADGLIHETFHNVGDIEFAFDGSLMFTWGDAAGNAADDPGQLRSQDLDAPAGKLFRINPATGAGYTNNPHYLNSVNTWRSRVWAYGLRNGFRFEVHPYWSNSYPASRSTRPWPGRVYVGDVGRYQFDEIDIVKGGENFGWPRFEGNQPYRPGEPIVHAPPAVVLPHPENRCVMAGAFYSGTAWPTAWRNGLFAADFVEGWLRVYRPNAHHTTLTEVPFGTGIRGVTDMRYDAATDSILFLGRGEDIIFNNSTGLDGLFRLVYDPD